MQRNPWIALFALVIVATACAPAAPGASRSGSEARAPPASEVPSRTVVIATKVEPTTLAPRALSTTGVSPTSPVMNIFSAWLMAIDGRGGRRPLLAEKQPELNTGDWIVFPDGTMETTYHLRPNLTWHDGTPLTASDFVFGFQVFSNPDLGLRIDQPMRLIKEVVAPDDRTVVIHWKQSFTDADGLNADKNGGLAAMPRHLLEEKYRTAELAAFVADPYWTTGFVGSGPFRLDRWEPGAYIEASAFENYVEGRPKVNRLKWVFLANENAAVASLLAGEVHLVAVEAIALEQASLLRQQWADSHAGEVIFAPTKSRFLQVELKDAYVNPRALLDVRVRRAFLEATDRASLSEAIIEGQQVVAHSIAGMSEEYSTEMDRAITKYPYDLQEATRLLAQAGITKGSDGAFADASGQKLSLEIRVFPNDPGPREIAILADQWKRFGVEVNQFVIPAAQSQDLELASAYPSFRIEQSGLTGTTAVVKLSSSVLATPQNRWTGSNRGGWVNAEYDRGFDTFVSSLDRNERNRSIVQALKVASDELPILPLYYLSQVAARASALEGPYPGADSELSWDNVSAWHWTK